MKHTNRIDTPRTAPFFAVTSLLLLLCASAATAQPGNGPGGGPGGRPDDGGRIAELLGLNEAQQAAWDAARKAHRTAVEPTLTLLSETREQLREALQSRNDLNAITELTGQMNALRNELKSAMDSLHDQLNAVLDAEQQVLWAGYLALGGPGHPSGGGRRSGRR